MGSEAAPPATIDLTPQPNERIVASPLAALASRLAWLQTPVCVFLTSRLICFLAGAFVVMAHGIEKPEASGDAPRVPWIDWTVRYDSGWYFRIIEAGYSYTPTEQSPVAFFPLYPTMIQCLSPLLDGPMWASFWLNHVAFLGGLIYVYALGLRLLPDRDSADRALWLIGLFPMSFFFSSFYTESLFLFLCAGTFYHAQRRQWGWAVFWAALGSGCRIPGVLLYGYLMLEWLKDVGWTMGNFWTRQAWSNLARGARRHWRVLLLIQFALAGLIAYMAYLQIEFDDPLAFQKTQVHWGRKLAAPWTVIYEAVKKLLEQDFWHGIAPAGLPADFVSIFNLTVLVGGYGLCILTWRRFGAPYGLFCLGSLLLPGSSELISMGRFFAVIVPFFFYLGEKLHHPALERVVFALSTGLLAIFTALSSAGFFIG